MAAPGRSLGLSSEPCPRSGLTNRARAEEGWERLEEQKESHVARFFWYQQSRTMRYSLPPHRTVEQYRYTALDVRELYRHRVFNQPVGSVWRNCALTWPWLRWFRLGSASLELELLNGRHVTVPLILDGMRHLQPLLACLSTMSAHCPPTLRDRRTVRLPALRPVTARLATQKRGWPEIPPSAQNSAKARRDAIAAYAVSPTSPIYAP